MSDTKPTILAIDDAEGVRRLLEVTLGKSWAVKTAPDAHSALAWAQLATPPDLVLLDTEPAGMSGYELCKALRAMPGFAEVPVVFLAERREAPGVVQAFQLGAMDFLVKPLAAPLVLQRVRGHLEHLARERTAGVQGGELRIGRLVRAMGLYERSLGGNRAARLARYARALAQAAGARETAADLLAKAAPVHDVGKLIVPPELLHNERGLAGAEREQFERHAAAGAEIIGEHDDALLKLARTLALTHHEFWDGSGYPGRLQGNQIPSPGRLMAIVDAFESMTAAQYGGSRMTTDAAVAEITAGAGIMFDPGLVEALRKATPEFRKVHGAYPERAADAGDDVVIGAPSARLPAAKPAPSAAPADDLVLGAPARDPTDDAGLTMMGPLRLGGAAASSADKIREAIQRAAAKAQRPAAPPSPPPPPPQTRSPEPPPAPPVVEKPAAAPLDLQLEATAPAAIVAAALAQARPQAPAEVDQLRGELQIRMNELEATRAALVEARAQHAGVEALNTRVATLVSERAAADAALAQARAEVERLQRELAELRNKPVAVVDPQTEAEMARLRSRVTEVEAERSAAVAALLQERAEAERARTELVELRKRPALADRVSQLESELQQARAQISHSTAATAQLEGELARANAARSDSQAELERLNAELADLRSKPVKTQDSESQAEIARLRSRINDAETAQAAAAAALTEAQAERSGAAALLVQARAESERGSAEVRALRARVNELETQQSAGDVAAQRRDAEAADAESRLAEIETALLELQTKREDAEATLTALQARVADAQAELEAQTERVRTAAAEAPGAPAPEMVAAPAAPRPIATLLVVAFLFGALAMGVTYLLLHP
ncbi:MAG TPA: HD domain-containing phosphohydrolase [Burkholderiales bacterium]|nr:HD domain-containing phosphohydrolase [Burkholderiales bacterium]